MVRIRVWLMVVGGALAVAGIASATGLSGGSETINYTYDAKGRLVHVRHSGTVNNNVVANYTFDDADNRKTLNVTGAP